MGLFEGENRASRIALHVLILAGVYKEIGRPFLAT